MKTTLAIMAAGIGSRYGGGIKQLEPVGPSGEIIMDYSIHDAIEAGFNRIIFIIRKDIEEDFRAVIGDRIEAICRGRGVEVSYAFQRIDDLPEGAVFPEGRTKPWGTGQAVLACRGMIQEPFAVINADDYYGKEAFTKVHDFLQHYSPEHPTDFCMAGFVLKNTLSDNGGVTRGVCKMDASGFLTDVEETHDIVRTADGAAVEQVLPDGTRTYTPVDRDALVSMNMWGLTPEFMQLLEQGFREFFDHLEGNEEKAEYLIPIYIGELLKEGRVSVQVLPTDDRWFGVTYKEDKASVVESFRELIRKGVYQEDLFAGWRQD